MTTSALLRIPLLTWGLQWIKAFLNTKPTKPGHKKLKLSKTELIYKAKKFKVPPFTI